MNFTILRFDTIDSTNTEALKQARQGADEGLCVVARQQTAGRGRHGRVWISPADAGLYFSVVLRPEIEPRYLPLVTLTSGVAVHDALAALGLAPDIKWVNDILVDEKKICGILAESTDTPRGLAVVVGIGINLRSTNFPPDVAARATSIEECLGSNAPVEARPVEAALIREIDRWYSILSDDDGPAAVLRAWTERSSYAAGKAVTVDTGGERITGVTQGLEPNGALRVEAAGGDIRVIQAGDVEMLRTA
ncbi:MAG: biotin--[acetyl-CoA-carboxylase] ligase [Pyrinomonadaceae bacterium]